MERDLSRMTIELEKTTTDAFVGLEHYENDDMVPENALMPWSLINWNHTMVCPIFGMNF